MSEQKEPSLVNVTRLVFPVAFMITMLGMAYFAGTEHQRLNAIELTQQAGLAKLQDTIDTVHRMQLAIERHQSQTDQNQKMFMDLINQMKKP